MSAHDCPVCGADESKQKIFVVREDVTYGMGDKSVTVVLPLHECLQCGAQYMEQHSEAIRDFAVNEAMKEGK